MNGGKVDVPEKDGIIATTFTGGAGADACKSQTGKVTVRIDDTSVYVRMYCQ